MDILESLENLDVSEACFNDIVGIVENILGAIAKSDYSPEKKAELKKKAILNAEKESAQALERENIHPTKHILKRHLSKRQLQDSALKQGDEKRAKQEVLGYTDGNRPVYLKKDTRNS